MWSCFGLFYTVANDNTTVGAVRQDVAVLTAATVLVTAGSGADLSTEAVHHSSVSMCVHGETVA